MTPRERYILETMRDREGFLWLIDGYRWPYPALCYGKRAERITRIMLHQLERKGWIREKYVDNVFVTNSWDLSDAGRAALGVKRKREEPAVQVQHPRGVPARPARGVGRRNHHPGKRQQGARPLGHRAPRA